MSKEKALESESKLMDSPILQVDEEEDYQPLQRSRTCSNLFAFIESSEGGDYDAERSFSKDCDSYTSEILSISDEDEYDFDDLLTTNEITITTTPSLRPLNSILISSKNPKLKKSICFASAVTVRVVRDDAYENGKDLIAETITSIKQDERSIKEVWLVNPKFHKNTEAVQEAINMLDILESTMMSENLAIHHSSQSDYGDERSYLGSEDEREPINIDSSDESIDSLQTLSPKNYEGNNNTMEKDYSLVLQEGSDFPIGAARQLANLDEIFE